MPHVADENGALPFGFELEKDVARRMAWRRVDLDEVVKPVRPATYQFGFAIFENQHDAFAESAQFGWSLLRISIDLREIVDVRFALANQPLQLLVSGRKDFMLAFRPGDPTP